MCFINRFTSIIMLLLLTKKIMFLLLNTFFFAVVMLLHSAKIGTMPAILETDDVEAAVAKAVGAGAVKVEEEVEGEEGGVKGKVTDPFGFTWIFVSPAKKNENDENKEV